MLIRRPSRLAILIAAIVLAVPAFVIPAYAAHRKNWVQRHPTITAVGAGIATHHYLKVRAARDKAAGRKLTWAERHPTLSAIGVGAVTRHVIKKTTPKD